MCCMECGEECLIAWGDLCWFSLWKIMLVIMCHKHPPVMPSSRGGRGLSSRGEKSKWNFRFSLTLYVWEERIITRMHHMEYWKIPSALECCALNGGVLQLSLTVLTVLQGAFSPSAAARVLRAERRCAAAESAAVPVWSVAGTAAGCQAGVRRRCPLLRQVGASVFQWRLLLFTESGFICFFFKTVKNRQTNISKLPDD